MKRSALVLLFRGLLAIGVELAMPLYHVWWGVAYPGDGQQAFGVVVLFTLMGAVAAVVYFIVGSAVQLALRRSSWRWTAGVDAMSFLLFVGLFAYGGSVAEYEITDEQDADNAMAADLDDPAATQSAHAPRQ